MCMDGDLIGGVMRGVMRGVVGYLFPKRDQVLKKPDLLSRCATGPEGGATLHRLPRWEALSALRASFSYSGGREE